MLLFLINKEDYDYVLIAVDLLSQKFILYDCYSEFERPKDTFNLDVKKLKRFLTDFLECYPVERSDGFEYDNVEDWKFEEGVCFKPTEIELQTFGHGIFIMKYLDLIT